MNYQLHRDNEEYFRFGTCFSTLHFHRAIELIYCIRTPKPVIVGGEEKILQEGELLIVPPLTPHIFPPHKNLHALCVVYPVSYSELFEEQLGGKQLEDLIVHDKALAKDLYKHLCMLENCTAPLLKQSIYLYVLARLLQTAPLIEAKHAASSDFSIEVLQYIERHYAEKLTSAAVAKALGYSPCYFSSLFNQQFRSTFSAYLNTVRINKAIPLLKNHAAADVAERVGFRSQQSFYQNFKKVTGTTPAEYLRTTKKT